MVKKLYSDLPKSQQQDLKQNNTELQFSHTKDYNNENLELEPDYKPIKPPHCVAQSKLFSKKPF